MSHMWFGDLVTMKWWDDLWLNESFAEYMSHRCLVDATEYTDAWVDSSIVRKVWGYGAERSPSTHPVAGVEALDAQSALQNFDGISYAKGAATLRQLIAYVGDDQFIAGVARLPDRQVVWQRHARRLPRRDRDGERQGPRGVVARLAAHGRPRHDLGRASRSRAESSSRAVVHRQSPPTAPPTGRTPSTSPGWTDGRELGAGHGDDHGSPRRPSPSSRARRSRPSSCRTPRDLTWARVRLSDSTLAALPTQLAQIPDGQARAVVWSSLIDGVHGATASPEAFLEVVRRGVAARDELLDPDAGRGLRRAPRRAVLRPARAAGCRAGPAQPGRRWRLLERATAGTHRVPGGGAARRRHERRRGAAARLGRRRGPARRPRGRRRLPLDRRAQPRLARAGRRRRDRGVPRQGRHPAGRPQRAHVPCQPARSRRPRPGRGSS